MNYLNELILVRHKQRVFIIEKGFESTTYKILIEHYEGLI